MAQTIHFNTGRKYTIAGQRITATLHDDGIVTFWDHDRQVDGEFVLLDCATFSQTEVMLNYDRMGGRGYGYTKRSREDGMMRGGCNTKWEG